MLRDSRSKYINSVCADRNNNPKRFWSLFKLKSNVSNVPEKVSMARSDGVRTSAESPEAIATIFNSYSTSIFTKDQPNTETYELYTNGADHDETTTTSLLDDTVLAPDHVAAVLRNPDNNKAHGPDGIPARLLTETAYQIAPSLCDLFNKPLRTGAVPQNWKLANVVSVYKKGDKEHVENYRPISLLPLISKVLERCLFDCIKDRVFSQINDCQHGFIPRKNCVTQLIEVFDKIGNLLDRGKQIDVIYLDMSKAFDKVSHKRLLRLRESEFSGNILNWFHSYLQDRSQQTTILGATSSPRAVTSGVP